MDKDILRVEDLLHRGKRPNLATIVLRLFRHFKTTSNITNASAAHKKLQQRGQQDRNP